MATVSAQSSPYGSPDLASPPFKGLKKVFSGRRRSLDNLNEDALSALRTDSIDSMNLDRSPTRQSINSSPSRGSVKSGSSSVRKLIPGHTKRQRRKVREEELKIAVEEAERGRSHHDAKLPAILSRSTSDSLHDGDSLLTDDSEVDIAPPLISRDSHVGYLTTSSPLVKSAKIPEQGDSEPFPSATFDDVPAITEPPKFETSPSPGTIPITSESNPILPTPGLLDKADTLRPDSRRNSISKLRGKSPGRRLKDVFLSRSNKSPRTSPERKAESHSGAISPLSRESTLVASEPETLEASLSRSVTTLPEQKTKSTSALPALNTESRPLTPTKALIGTPVTTVTPPTPTDVRKDGPPASPQLEQDDSTSNDEGSKIVVSPSGNMISHRRVRSAGPGSGSGTHLPSKLSNSMTAPLTPTGEGARTPSGMTSGRTVSGSFFSSWVSAAQNAATSIGNLAGPSRTRSGTTTSDSAQTKQVSETIKEEPEHTEETPRKQLAVETLGAGDLNLGHLGIDEKDESDDATRPSLTELRNNSVIQRDVAAAKEEDALAKRAVSAAYEKMNEGTPIAELPDPMNQLKHAQTFSSSTGGESTTPNGSIFEGETGSVKRSNSVRSKLANRRSRGSSTATGQTTIGAMVGASTSALANPATGPRLTGFAIAPKQRNRNFHQQFRSVPEDDFLVEDYSCALQREILLAGRIYISEGHICFSSNILGWVTTLVISFEEVVSIEKETTALVIPNAIAIQTLHARHTFRSLLSREATYDLLIGIWKVSHPASFQKSINGKQMAAEEATKEATGAATATEASPAESDQSSDDDDGSDEDDGSAPSLIGSNASVTGSDHIEPQAVTRKPSAINGAPLTHVATAPATITADTTATPPVVGGSSEPTIDFPGPVSHAPTECSDSATHYEIVIKDEVLSAPLGKIYSLLYGPQSGAFVRKFLVDECKVTDLVLEDDKKGLDSTTKSRQYSYIKPLGGSIGPKQTKCITTETLDCFDLEKAVTVTCSTQTPDVPSGNAFLTKTRYCLTWAAGNATRFQMNCTVEWSAKSWLKGPIEKGAKEGQQQYGDSITKVLKAAISRARGATVTSKVSKTKKRRKGEKREKSEKVEADTKKEENWGLFEPLRGPLGPVVQTARPILKSEFMLGFLLLMVLVLWFRGPRTGQLSPYAGWKHADRLTAYEEMWTREESELWTWLEDRTGVDSIHLRQNGKSSRQQEDARQAQKLKQRQKALKSKDVEARLREEKMSEKEMEEAIRITKERLEILESVVQNRKSKRSSAV